MNKTSLDKVDKNIELAGNKALAIENWRITRGHITDLCSATGISRQTYYDWLNDDPEFAQAIADAESELNDDMREALIHKAGSGELPAITYYLDRRHPDFKKQNNTVILPTAFVKAEEKAQAFVVEVEDGNKT